MTPECANCGEHVSASYARVLSVGGEVRACPAEECGGRRIVDITQMGGGERMIAESATQSGRTGGGA